MAKRAKELIRLAKQQTAKRLFDVKSNRRPKAGEKPPDSLAIACLHILFGLLYFFPDNFPLIQMCPIRRLKGF